MKVILIAAMSLDGYITKGSDANIYNWTSKEDSKYFFQKIEEAELIIMGSKTYGVARHFIKHKNGRMRIVFTRNPQKYSSEVVHGFLDFTSNDPVEVLSSYKRHTKEALLVGGEEINTLFLRKNLVDEIWITVEPYIFGEGKKLAQVSKKLKLLSTEKLNKRGTMLLKYKVISQV